MKNAKPIELKGETCYYLLFESMIYQIQGLQITKMFPPADYTESFTYDNEQDRNIALREIQQKHEHEGSDIRLLSCNYNSHYTAAGGYYVVQFRNMIIVLDALNDNILYSTDMGYNIAIAAEIQSSADGKILCLLVHKKIRFIDTKSWQIIGQKNVSPTFHHIRFAPTGYKMILSSHEGYAWLWDLTHKTAVIYKFSNKDKIGQHGFFINEDTIGLWDRLSGLIRFYDLSNGMVELPEKYPYVPYISFLFDSFLLLITGERWNTVVRLDRKNLKVIDKISIEKEIYLPSFPIRHENNALIFSEYITHNNTTIATNILKYEVNNNTVSLLKKFEGRLVIIAYITAEEILTIHDRQLVRYRLSE